MKRNRKVLFIASHFPPCKEVGGSIRSEKFVKYLPKYGWNPQVVSMILQKTSDSIEFNSEIIRLPSALPFTKPYDIVAYGWAFNVWRYLKNKNGFDAIYISCPPFPQTIAGVLLKWRFKCPLIIDLRDAWSLDPYQEGSRLKRVVYKYIFPTIEKWVFKNSHHLIMNTPSMLRAYEKKYPDFSHLMSHVPNGFDESDFSRITSADKPNRAYMEILYCGRFGVGNRSPRLLFNAIKSLDEECNVKLVIVGDQPEWVIELLKKMNLDSFVSIYRQIPHSDMVQRMMDSDVLLAYQEYTSASIQAVAGKTFEYLRSGKPILSIAPEGDNQALIRKYSAQSMTVTQYNEKAVMASIKSLYTDWVQNTGTDLREYNEEYNSQYNRQILTQKLSEILDKAVENN